MHIPTDVVNEPLYVITCLFDSQRYKRRAKLYRDFQKMVRDAGAILITVEVAFGDREFQLEDHAPPSATNVHDGQFKSFGPANVPPSAAMPPSRLKQDYIKVRASSDNQNLWQKEALLNVGLKHLPPDAKYVAFIDSDIVFARPDWVAETLQKLSIHPVVQMFSTCIDMSPKYEPLRLHRSFMWCYENDIPASWKSSKAKPGYDVAYYGEAAISSKLPAGVNPWHPGYCWSFRREALDLLGGLLDWAPLGAGDHHMALALIGKGKFSVAGGMHPNYLQGVLDWEKRATKYINGNVGFVNGTILHQAHGSKASRKYLERWKILRDYQFDPRTDSYKDTQGLYQLTDDKPGLRDDIRKYFAQRDEDQTYVPPNESYLLGPVQ